MTENLRHWEALRKIDPKHTKSFARSGGFKGTAIKPIYAARMMTEHFGPCGKGWGMRKPEFTTMTVGDEILVYCTVELWYHEPGNGSAEGVVYGVGGDKVAAKRQSGAFTDDEAFKKAYTDALGNAMKQLGVGADVHMGLFDDAKYVNELRKEFAEDAAPAAPSQRPTASAAPPADSPEALKAEAEALAKRLKTADSLTKLEQIMDDARPFLQKLPDVTYKHLGGIYEKRRTAMETPS